MYTFLSKRENIFQSGTEYGHRDDKYGMFKLYVKYYFPYVEKLYVILQ